MRQLHAVSIKERFVASGVYMYSRGEQQQPVREAWTIHELPDNSQLIRVDREEKGATGLTLLLEILRSASGKIDRFDSQFYGGANRVIRQAKATFSFFEDQVQIGRILNQQTRQHDVYPVPPAAWVYPNTYALLGSVIAGATASGKAEPVWSFSLEDSDLYTPQVDDFKMLSADDRPQMLPQVWNQPVRAYQLRYQTHAENTWFWLDEYDTVVRMETRQPHQHFIMTLTHYTRRPEKDHD